MCPQADCLGERELPGINREFKEMGPQADGGGEQQLSKIGQQLIKNNYYFSIVPIYIYGLFHEPLSKAYKLGITIVVH